MSPNVTRIYEKTRAVAVHRMRLRRHSFVISVVEVVVVIVVVVVAAAIVVVVVIVVAVVADVFDNDNDMKNDIPPLQYVFLQPPPKNISYLGFLMSYSLVPN